MKYSLFLLTFAGYLNALEVTMLTQGTLPHGLATEKSQPGENIFSPRSSPAPQDNRTESKRDTLIILDNLQSTPTALPKEPPYSSWRTQRTRKSRVVRCLSFFCCCCSPQ